MKSTIHAATAAGLVLASAAAHAQLPPPAQNPAAPPTSTGMYLAVYDTNSTVSEVVNLGYDQALTSYASGNMNPTAPNSAFTVAAAPTGSGQVLQLNFGQISGFTGASPIFTAANAATTEFMVYDAIGGAAGTIAFQATSNTGTPTTAFAGMTGIVNNIQGEIASWTSGPPSPATGDEQDTTGTATWAVKTGLLNGGQLLSSQFFNGVLDQATPFYDLVTTSAHRVTNSTYAGYWYLSDTGTLSYDVPYATAVPVPAAVWLLGSGLLGLAGIGRRRVAAG